MRAARLAAAVVAVTAALSTARRIRKHLRFNAAACVALFMTFAIAPAWAAMPRNSVGARQLNRGAVTTQKIANRAVTRSKLATGAVDSARVLDNSLRGADIDELTLDLTVLQRRLQGSCPAGEAIRAVAEDGGVICVGGGASGSAGGDLTGMYPNPLVAAGSVNSTKVADDSLTGADIDESTLGQVPSSGALDGIDSSGFWMLTGNAGTNPLTQFLGTTDNQPLNLRVGNARALRLEPASDGSGPSPNVIGGTADNAVTSGVHSATIAGGGRSSPGIPTTANRVTDNGGTIGGGAQNVAGDSAGAVDSAIYATVGGGLSNIASGERATVAGGDGNRANAIWATVGGGDHNTAGDTAFVGGGFLNSASGTWSTVGGGSSNTAGGARATVGGGESNNASQTSAAVAGGSGNSASQTFAAVGGGTLNIASGSSATVPGGNSNIASGDFSLAAGRRAQASHTGAFVWADSSNVNFGSTTSNQFRARTTGGAQFVSAINGSGIPTAGVELAAGGGSWASLSDEASKTAIEPISGREVLAKLDLLPISEWSYRSQGPGIRHIGPMAQDFYRAFGVGEDSRHITSIDADGVALAAIKALSEENEDLRARMGAAERELAKLRKLLRRADLAR